MKEKNNKPKVSKSGKKSTSGFLFAARIGDVNKLRELLDDGANIERKNNRGLTALYLATRGGHLECAKLLLDRGADVNATSKNGNSAIILASTCDILKLLLDHGADVDMKDREGFTPLINASLRDCSTCVALLLERGADPNLPGAFGKTASDYFVSKEIRKMLDAAANQRAYVLK